MFYRKLKKRNAELEKLNSENKDKLHNAFIKYQDLEDKYGAVLVSHSISIKQLSDKLLTAQNSNQALGKEILYLQNKVTLLERENEIFQQTDKKKAVKPTKKVIVKKKITPSNNDTNSGRKTYLTTGNAKKK